MNIYILYFLVILHLFVWIFSIFGGFIHKNVALFNVYVFLPIIYIFQCLPNHIIIWIKIYIINKNGIHHTCDMSTNKYTKDYNTIKKMAESLRISTETAEKHFDSLY